MRTVNIHQAKTQLSKLLEAVGAGEEIIIAKAGKPVARLGPLVAERSPVQFGVLRDQIWIADDFDAPLPDDIQRLFEGQP